MKQKEIALIPLIVFLGSIGFVATDLYLPSLPAIVQEFSTSNEKVQLTLSFYLFAFAISQLFYGPLSEKKGRKKVAIYGLSLTLVGSVVCMFSPTIEVLIGGRFLEGVGVGATPVVTRAILRDTYKGDQLARKGSFLAIGTGVFMAGAPIIGGYIQHTLGWRYNFLFIVIYTLLGIGSLIYLFSETLKEHNPHAIRWKTMQKNFITLLKSPIFMAYAGCGSLVFSGLTAYLAISPFLFQDVIGISSVMYGWLALFLAIGLILGGITNSFLVHYLGRHIVLKLGVWLEMLAGISMLSLALIGYLGVFSVMIPMLIFMFGAGFVFNNAFAGAFHFFSKIAGFAGALYGFCQILGGTLASSIMTVFHAKDQIPLAIYLLIIAIISLFLQKLGHRFTLQND